MGFSGVRWGSVGFGGFWRVFAPCSSVMWTSSDAPARFRFGSGFISGRMSASPPPAGAPTAPDATGEVPGVPPEAADVAPADAAPEAAAPAAAAAAGGDPDAPQEEVATAHDPEAAVAAEQAAADEGRGGTTGFLFFFASNMPLGDRLRRARAIREEGRTADRNGWKLKPGDETSNIFETVTVQ